MTIDLSLIDREQFVVRDCVIAGDDCALVFPQHICADWRPDNLHLRSIICRKSDGFVISRGHDKWFNHGEKPSLYPDPSSFNDWRVSTKLDGSLIIVSKYKGELIVRTRGTATIDVYETAAEVRMLLAPMLERAGNDSFCFEDDLRNNSFLFEHCTPSNPIVVRYDKPSLTLLDVISHEDSYWSAKQVDQVALCLGCARPDIHTFGSLDEIVESLKTLSGMEGYVLSYNDNRNRVKLKGLEYLKLHAFRSTVSLNNLLDLFFLYSRPDAASFLSRLESKFDWESAQMARALVERICTAYSGAVTDVVRINEEVNSLRALSRRDAAMAIQKIFDKMDRSVAFNCLDNKPLDDKMLRKLMENALDGYDKTVTV
jgi:hypothetical protein